MRMRRLKSATAPTMASRLVFAFVNGHLSRLLWHDFGTYVYILQ